MSVAKRVLIAAVAVVLIILGGVGLAFGVVFPRTEKATFCPVCHEMRPYYNAWRQGQHSTVECHACHVAPGTAAYLANKVYALKEVWIHVTGRPVFPAGNASVPSATCLSCHPRVPPNIKLFLAARVIFKHVEHAEKVPCSKCHWQTGHRVTLGALKREGVLSPHAAQPGAVPTNGGLKGHPPEFCFSCHRPSRTPCHACHIPPHKVKGPCIECHRPGPRWVFTHPTGPGATDCVKCHRRPTGHFVGPCGPCHRTTVPFAKTRFLHPKRIDCSRCHERPSNHFPKFECSRCHRFGIGWPFHHTRSDDCRPCHVRPRGHVAGPCRRCHQAGVSWAFTHPSSSDCSACHPSPPNHFGSNCASCHTPSAPWTSATFNHPSAGEHGYRDFPCSKCHPNGFAIASCTCHGGRPPSGD